MAVHFEELAELTRLAAIAVALARTLKAELIGVATATSEALTGESSLTLDWGLAQQRASAKLMERMKSHVRPLAPDINIEWRSAIATDPTAFLLSQAVLADLAPRD